MKTHPEDQPNTLPKTHDLDRERLAECVAFLLLAYHRHHATASTPQGDQGKCSAK